MNEQLYKRYSDWSNDQLLEAYEQKEQYTEASLTIMKQVIREKGLEKEMIAIDDAKEEKTAQRNQQEVEKIQRSAKAYEQKILGDHETPSDFTRKQKSPTGIYYEVALGNKSNTLSVSILFIGLGFSAAIIGGVAIAQNFFMPQILYYVGLPGILAVVAGIYLYRYTRSVFRLAEEGSSLYLEIIEKNKHYKIRYPFQHYHFCGSVSYSVNHIPVNKNAVLCVAIHCPAEDLNIVLEEELGSLVQSAPPDWPKETYIPVAGKTLLYTPYIGNRVNLFRLKNILDGMDDIYAKR